MSLSPFQHLCLLLGCLGNPKTWSPHSKTHTKRPRNKTNGTITDKREPPQEPPSSWNLSNLESDFTSRASQGESQEHGLYHPFWILVVVMLVYYWEPAQGDSSFWFSHCSISSQVYVPWISPNLSLVSKRHPLRNQFGSFADSTGEDYEQWSHRIVLGGHYPSLHGHWPSIWKIFQEKRKKHWANSLKRDKLTEEGLREETPML